MKFQLQAFRNSWFVDGKEVDNIIVFDNMDGGRVLIDTQISWIGAGGHGASAWASLDDVTEVKRRMKVDLSRAEHFYTAIKANKYVGTHITLYLNAALFHGRSSINRVPSYSDEMSTTYRNCMEICARVNGEEQPRWISIWAGGGQCDIVVSPLGELCDKVRALFNDKVSSHRSYEMGRSEAKRLLDILPELQQLKKASGLTL